MTSPRTHGTEECVLVSALCCADEVRTMCGVERFVIVHMNFELT